MRDRLVLNNLERLHKTLSRVKVVYTDLDNTLLGPGSSLFMTPDHQYSLVPATSLVNLISSGVDVVLVSGRNNSQLREISRVLGLSNYIAELGCLLYYDGGRQIVENYDYPVPEGKSLHEAISAGGAPDFLLRHFEGRLEYHTPWAQRQTCTHLFRGLIDVHLANALLATEGFADLRIVDNGASRSPGSLVPLPEIRVYHLLPKDTNKASALILDQKNRGFLPEETIAMGDSLADMEMAGAVGAFFLVADGVADNPQLNGELLTYKNAYLTSQKMGLGWAEVAGLIVGE